MARSASPASSIATASSRAVKLRMRRVMAGAASRRRSTSRGRKEGRVLRQTEGDSRGRGAGAEGLGELKRALDVRERAAEEFGEVQRARRRLQARRAAHEQLVPQQRPEAGQGRAHRRLGAADARPGPGDAALGHEGVEGDEQVEVDAMQIHEMDGCT